MSRDPRDVLREAGDSASAPAYPDDIQRRLRRRRRQRRARALAVVTLVPVAVLAGSLPALLAPADDVLAPAPPAAVTPSPLAQSPPPAPDAVLPPRQSPAPPRSSPPVPEPPADPEADPDPATPPAGPVAPATDRAASPTSSPQVADRIDLEAEAARLEEPMRIAADPGASGGAFTVVANGTAQSGEGWAEFSVPVPTAGDYLLWARVRAPDGRSNSFYVTVDGGDRIVFDVPGPGEDAVAPDWTWAPLVRRGSTEPWRYRLGAGAHRLRLINRQDGTQLDRIVLTTDPTLVPER